MWACFVLDLYLMWPYHWLHRWLVLPPLGKSCLILHHAGICHLSQAFVCCTKALLENCTALTSVRNSSIILSIVRG